MRAMKSKVITWAWASSLGLASRVAWLWAWDKIGSVFKKALCKSSALPCSLSNLSQAWEIIKLPLPCNFRWWYFLRIQIWLGFLSTLRMDLGHWEWIWDIGVTGNHSINCMDRDQNATCTSSISLNLFFLENKVVWSLRASATLTTFLEGKGFKVLKVIWD